MIKPEKLEQYYDKFLEDPTYWVQDGIVDVNLEMLKDWGLLNQTEEEEKLLQDQFPFYFHVLENNAKVTLFNNQFIVWIVPDVVDENPCTSVMIALIKEDDLKLEIVYKTHGVYNTPKYVLKTLRHFLTEVIDTEEEISSFLEG
ncbi:MAG: hypothetical protein SP4CHLAM5_05600 [Chlamydiia bacterium]|nr:hypothetical protein [Chlamydiia bacterium]MCH9618430.1 hypothetical protein [Chlamydiia bacterium]MCH9623756.1 hypothetical protein [Chlamydiia bacterium]